MVFRCPVHKCLAREWIPLVSIITIKKMIKTESIRIPMYYYTIPKFLKSHCLPVSCYCMTLTSVFSLSVSVCLGCFSKQETAKFTKRHLRNACRESRRVKCSYALLLIYSSLLVSHINPVSTVTQCKGHFIEMHVCNSKYSSSILYIDVLQF